ncbi:hypothetical protein CYMTET_16741 [Cymbomonas tetramitiformis]|uniref:Uncharacterized protein n=1 Tax=Cymbomonas tetramitiformis TaxID=36881 RepID=A0AAE0GBL8_9CHLO|nr:hypothetical protein CYMTET_16741 [Cymbomonas tetramitiformis]
MDSPQISSSEELRALLATIDGKLQNLDSFNRSRTVSLIHSMARALSHFQSSNFPVALSAASTPVVLQIVVSEASTHVGGAQGAEPETVESGISGVSFCDKGVGDCMVYSNSRSVSCQVTTTRPSPSIPEARDVVPQAPPVRTEVHYIHAPPSTHSYLHSGQRQLEEYESSETEDESEYPVGYFDDSEDDLEEEEGYYGHLAYAPHFSTLRLEQGSGLDTGLQLESYGGVLEPSIEEGFLPQYISDVDDNSIVEPLPEPTVEEFEHENFPEAAFAEGEEHDDGYTAEEWAAWDAGAYTSHEYGGASEGFAEHFDEYVDDEYYSDDYCFLFVDRRGVTWEPATCCS